MKLWYIALMLCLENNPRTCKHQNSLLKIILTTFIINHKKWDFVSKFFKVDVMVVETKCVTKEDPYCEFEVAKIVAIIASLNPLKRP